MATTSPVRDESVIEFELQFYQAIFSGKTIQGSFETAKNSLMVSNDHLDRSDEDLFVLLGPGDHSRTSLFSKTSKVSFFNTHLPPRSLLINLPLGVDAASYIGRAVDVNNVLRYLSNSARLTTITGPSGVGKSSLVIRAVRYR